MSKDKNWIMLYNSDKGFYMRPEDIEAMKVFADAENHFRIYQDVSKFFSTDQMFLKNNPGKPVKDL